MASLTAVYLLSFAGMLIGFSDSGRHREDGDEGAVRFVKGPEADMEDLAGAEAPEPQTFTRTVEVSQDLIPACCEELRTRYRLTDRETEVMELIARGRNLARISEMLYVSQNTVRSHCRNLYRKLDVHSRQGILDLLEEAKNEI